MKTEWDRIDEKPICIRCGKKATYYMKRNGLFHYSYKEYCEDCLRIMLEFYKIK